MKKRKPKRNYTLECILYLLTAIVFFLLGYVSNKPKMRELQYTNFYSNDTHYIVFQGAQGTSVVNYTIDSIRKEMANPATQLLFK
jgi:hypothetical protein